MANDRMYIRCKGCGDLHFLAKCYDDGYFTTHEGEELRQGLDDFFDRHKWCYRDKYYGGFELVYESDDWLEKQKEQKPVEPSDDELQRHQDELYDFKVFAAKQAKEHHISFVHDFEWNNFCAELLSYFNEQKPVSNPKWAELTWKDINELERIINNVHYEFQNGIGEDSFGELVLERFKEYKDDGSMDEQEPADLTKMMVHKEPYLAPVPIPMVTDEQKQEWSEEDEKMLSKIIKHFDWYDSNRFNAEDCKEAQDFLKSLRPQPKRDCKDCAMFLNGECTKPHWKPSEEQMKALQNAVALTACDKELARLYNQLKKL